jgi:hypothetical protein
MKNPPQHKDFDTVVYKLLDATRKAFRKEQHGEAKQYLAEAMQAADRFARYLHTVDGPEVAQKFRQDLKRPVARVAQIMEQHGGRLDGFDVEKLGKTCPHDGVKIGELCKCGALMKHQSLSQQADRTAREPRNGCELARFERADPKAHRVQQDRSGREIHVQYRTAGQLKNGFWRRGALKLRKAKSEFTDSDSIAESKKDAKEQKKPKALPTFSTPEERQEAHFKAAMHHASWWAGHQGMHDWMGSEHAYDVGALASEHAEATGKSEDDF